ncbi:glycoside hydrolase family 2 TIM barrel-domain containing protein [Streptomyces luomodiensis]|uniref:Glycoside hydrolase family 2 TIM barrel-domain containing protein n=1 Tax=Streptomyces luomodiensis TaxID=3026192 RepID=A0ABY9V6I9_9ACTN|nr:sugar-binding domain-containing protein [Streptomyces sp. SCA4-21]WNF00404.1 glycoside hydrolase family 2 TIM barrel-domain containing protein [Streptomyces sp. SCA4-21]
MAHTDNPSTEVSNAVPRPEYPRPSFVREEWLNLNGTWQFAFDPGDSGLERGLVHQELSGRILVPFCPESELSGIGDTDFHPAVWYRRTVHIPADWSGRRVLLHFGAVDHDATVWADGREVARHSGGFTSFTADLGEVDGGTEMVIVVRARDARHGPQARGKQSTEYANHAAHYTRTTGIWQTVWMEPVSAVHLRRPRITPDLASGAFHLELPLSANRPGHRITARVTDADGESVAEATVRADLDLAPRMVLTLPEDRCRPWSPEDPHLYRVRIELLDADGATVDRAECTAGLRSVAIDGKRLLLNGRPVFQRLVLDQGWYPDGLMTAPDDAALVRDIELSLAAGFNGARLHQKVFEERFLHHADRLGYLVWGEFGDWGSGTKHTTRDNQQPTAGFITQWLEAVERDYSHPSIVGWCPLNETHQELHDRQSVLDDVTRGMFLATKAADTSRPVLDASGYSHRVLETDVYDSHSYEQDPREFRRQMAGLDKDQPLINPDTRANPEKENTDAVWSVPYRGQPYFCSEFGGIWWNPEEAAAAAGDDRQVSWGYGQRPRTEEEFHERFAGLTAALLDDPLMFGYCYTQLTDVFQEQNGVYRFDRGEKLDVARLRAAQQRPAAFERPSGEEGR